MKYAELLDSAHRAAGGVVAGPGGYAYATPHLLPAGSMPVPQPVTEHVGVSCARLSGPHTVSRVFRGRLLTLHADLLEDVLAQAVDDLGRRSSEGKPLLSRQLVQAGIADAAMLVEQVRGLLAFTDPAVDVQTVLFRRLVHGGRALLRLLGGASFLLDGPGGTVMAAELVGRLYLGAPE